MSRLVYIDTFSNNIMHEMYNAASISCFGKLFNDVIYYADYSSKKNIYAILKKDTLQKIKYRRILIPPFKSGLNAILRQFLAVFFNILIIVVSKSDDTIVINYNTMISNYPINFILKFLDRKVIVICHGEMSDLIVERKTSFIFKKSKLFFSNPKLKISEGLYFAVLGDSIKHNLKAYLSSQLYRKMLSLDHPFVYDSVLYKKTTNSKMLKVGFVGALRPSKGLCEFARLAKRVSVTSNNVVFYVAGNNSKYKSYLTSHNIKQMNGYANRFLTRAEMYEAASNLDYIISLQDDTFYKYTASGSVFDFINCEVPFLSIKNDYFTYLKNKFGDFGEFFHNIESLEERIKSLNKDRIYYDFNTFKKSHSIGELSKKYKNELVQFKIL
jgi:glycosyltransferase involved in cell wall biosynthesis